MSYDLFSQVDDFILCYDNYVNIQPLYLCNIYPVNGQMFLKSVINTGIVIENMLFC